MHRYLHLEVLQDVNIYAQEFRISSNRFIGYADLITKNKDGTVDIFDFKYSNNIQNYLEYFWSPLIAQKFIKDALHVLSLLEANPMLGKYNTNLKCREIVISRHISLYYQIEKDYLELISFYNNRQKPINIIDL